MMDTAVKKPSFRGPSASRTGPLLIAAVAAIAAAILVVVALNKAQDDGLPAAGTVGVVVADRLIPKGTSGDAIAADRSFRVADIRGGAAVEGAVTDVSQIRGKVASADIYPGQQLAASEFAASDGGLATKLARDERAVALPIDQAHGLVGNVKSGDRVDVLAGLNLQASNGRTRPVVKTVATNVTVLKEPDGGAGGRGAQSVITLKVPQEAAAPLAFAADNGKVWVVLRAPGAAPASGKVVSAQNLLFGVKPVAGR
jgi:pilus assembly protein CpaB